MNNVRIEIIIGSIITIVLAIATGFYAGQFSERQYSFSPDRIADSNQAALPTDTEGDTSGTLTMAIVASHSKPSDCWIVVDGAVYDTTSYLELHPGGAGRITPFCGKDATTAFVTKDGEGQHSQKAYTDLLQLKIGTIGAALTPTSAGPTQNTVKPTTGSAAPVAKPAPVTIALTTAEVAKHSSAADCWVIANGSVYNATNYLTLHPGGAGRIIPFCGKDMTQAFATKGGGGSHSSSAFADLTQLKIGALNSNVPNTAVSDAAAAPQQGGMTTGDDDDAYDDD